MGVAEVGQRELHLAAGAHIAVELVGGDIAQQGFVLDQLDPAVALLHVLHEDRIGKARGEHLCDISRAEHQLRLQQRRAVGEAGLVEGRCGIGHQEVPVPANQVEAALLVNFQVGLGLGLAFGPDVVTAGLGVVSQRSVQIRHLATGHTKTGVDNAAHAIGLARRGEHALQGLDAVGAIFKGKDFAFERAAVGDGDLADAVFRSVNHTGGQSVFTLVVDLDRGITAGDLDLPITCADHSASQVDEAACGLDVIEDDGAGVGIKIAVDRGQPRGAVADALERVAQAVGEVAALGRRKVLGYGELNVVDPALQRAVHIEVARVDVDRAHRKDDGLLDHRREVGLDAVRVVGVVGVGDFLPAFALFVLLHVEVELFGLALNGVALGAHVINVDLVTHPHRIARLDGLQTRGGFVGVARGGGRRGRVGGRVAALCADPHKVVAGRIELEGVVGRAVGLHRAQHLATAVDQRELVGGQWATQSRQRHSDVTGLRQRQLVVVLVKAIAQLGRHRHLRAQRVGAAAGVVALGLAGDRQGLALHRRQQGLHPAVIDAKNAAARRAVVVVNVRAESFVEVQVLARVGAGVEPVLTRQIEVAAGTDVDRTGLHLASDIDTALHVGEVERAVGIGDLAAHIQVLRAAGCADRTQAAIDAIGLFGEGILRDANHALAARTGRA